MLSINCSLPQSFSVSPARKLHFSTEDLLQDQASGSGTIPFHFFFLKIYVSSVTRNKNVLSQIFHTGLQGVEKQKSFSSFSGFKPDSRTRSNTNHHPNACQQDSRCALWRIVLRQSCAMLLKHYVIIIPRPCFLHISQMLIHQRGVS